MPSCDFIFLFWQLAERADECNDNILEQPSQGRRVKDSPRCIKSADMLILASCDFIFLRGYVASSNRDLQCSSELKFSYQRVARRQKPKGRGKFQTLLQPPKSLRLSTPFWIENFSWAHILRTEVFISEGCP